MFLFTYLMIVNVGAKAKHLFDSFPMHHGQQLVVSLQQVQVGQDSGPLLLWPQTPLLIHLCLHNSSAAVRSGQGVT